MPKIEKEIKILDIDIEDARKRLNKINAEYIGHSIQQINVYDCPTIYYRFLEIRELIKSGNKLLSETNRRKFLNLCIEIVDLCTEEKIKEISDIFNVKTVGTLNTKDLLKLLNNERFVKLVETLNINPNKWIRLRKTNNKTQLTSKHIFSKNHNAIQKVVECEVNVSDFEETNKLLESIGLNRRSYQEKERYSYKYKNANIEIDRWPLIKPYIEIEAEDEEIINDIVNKLGYKIKETVSINTEQLFKEKGINIHEVGDLKFDK